MKKKLPVYTNYFKRLFDILIGITVLVLFLPVIIITTFLLAVATKGTPFFFQIRPGLNGELFKIVKFKTMSDEVNELGELMPDAQRITTLGLFVRKTSLDELPQLINVLKGEMSLIGPRPLLPEYLPLYSEEQQKRHLVKPGITGWAQVNGRNAISWQEKFDLDVWYVNNLSFQLDLKIVFLTIKKVLKREGISVGNSVAMEKFKGN